MIDARARPRPRATMMRAWRQGDPPAAGNYGLPGRERERDWLMLAFTRRPPLASCLLLLFVNRHLSDHSPESGSIVR